PNDGGNGVLPHRLCPDVPICPLQVPPVQPPARWEVVDTICDEVLQHSPGQLYPHALQNPQFVQHSLSVDALPNFIPMRFVSFVSLVSFVSFVSLCEFVHQMGRCSRGASFYRNGLLILHLSS